MVAKGDLSSFVRQTEALLLVPLLQSSNIKLKVLVVSSLVTQFEQSSITISLKSYEYE